jgi:hypothetical protein
MARARTKKTVIKADLRRRLTGAARCRSAVTGQFVSAAYARRYPRLTVKERA